jgi:hypothetical protein
VIGREFAGSRSALPSIELNRERRFLHHHVELAVAQPDCEIQIAGTGA